MGEESILSLFRTLDLKTRVAILRKSAEQLELTLPTDVARYIAQNLRSNAIALQIALARLLTHSSLTGTEITVTSARQVLKDFIDTRARKSTIDPVQQLPFQSFGTTEAKTRRHDSTAADRHFVLCLLKTRGGRDTSRVRHELEVNMREREREFLARRDAYERWSERRAKKRKQG